MKWLFWFSLAVIWYAYIGYPLLLWIASKLQSRPVNKHASEPPVSIVIAVRNEAARIASKLRNLQSLDYTKEKLEVIVVSDGSTDGTAQVLSEFPQVRAIVLPEHLGKAEALNRGLAIATGDVVVFTDVRQEIEPQAIRELAANFVDAAVGCVSGELMFRSVGGRSRAGVSVYWALEKMVRKLESATGSVVGATGALYAARRSMVPTLPHGTLLDDVYIPMMIARAGGRVIFEPNARAWDDESATPNLEFGRKVRTLAGNLQLVQLAPWLITRANPLRFRFVSHKLLRLLVPWFLVVLLISNITLARSSFYGVFAAGQAMFYLLAAIGLLGRRVPLAAAAGSFCTLNAAAATAVVKFWRYRHDPVRLWRFGSRTVASEQSRSGESQPVITNSAGGLMTATLSKRSTGARD